MKYISLLSLLFLMIVPAAAQEVTISHSIEDAAPYIYYYSEALNGVVIERADGTESRIIGQGLVDEDVTFVYGPGWSADGSWFAWRTVKPISSWTNPGKGYVISMNGQKTLDMLTRFPFINSMLWHPTENTLLAYTLSHVSPTLPIATYWLIDANTQTRLATFSIDSFREMGTGSSPNIYWQTDQQQIQFFEFTGANGSDTQYFLVTMSYDGTVTMKTVAEGEQNVAPQNNTLYSNAFGEFTHSLFSIWAEAKAEKTILAPSNSSAASSAAIAGQWDTSGNWLLLGYEFCFAGCAGVVGQVNIFNPETGYSREIANCGSHPTCVGWLPKQVNREELPAGRSTSVLPTPQEMDFDYTFLQEKGHYGLFDVYTTTHELVCNQGKLSDVRNKTTSEIDFVLPNGGSCGTPEEGVYPTQPIIFALTPDKSYYAITDSSEYTALYDAKNGDRIARMNFYGIELSFSEDSRSLITMGRYATATWDIEELLQNSDL